MTADRRRSFLILVALALAAVVPWFAMRPSSDAAGERGQAETEAEVAVSVARVTRGTVRRYVTAYGFVEPEPPTAERSAAAARIASPVPGVVAEVHAVEGQRVQRGTPLVRLDDRIAAVAIAKGQAAVEFAERTLARQRRLLKAEGASVKQVQEAEQQLEIARNDLANARAQADLMVVRAPLAGTVVRAVAKPGEYVDPASVLVEVIDLDRLVVAATVASVDLGMLRIGQPVEIRAAVHGENDVRDEVATGTLVYVGSQIDPRTDAAPVRIAAPLRAQGFRPGESVKVRIVTEEHRDRLVMPIEGVVATSEGTVAAVVDNGRATRTVIRTGIRDGGLVEIEGHGIRDGTVVVTKGAYGLPPETRVQILDPATASQEAPHVAS